MMHGVFGRCNKWLHNKSAGVLFLRVALGAFFLAHGISKFQNIEVMSQFFASIGFPGFWVYVVAASETIAGALLILGAFTWVSAFLITVMMVVAIVKVTGPNPAGQSFLVHYVSGWGTNLIYIAAAWCAALCGSGRWSLAAWWMRRKAMACGDCRKEDCVNCQGNKCVDCRSDHGMGHNCPECLHK